LRRTVLRSTSGIVARPVPVDDLTAEERIDLIGRLWDSLDPEAGESWSEIKAALEKKLR